MTTPSVSTAGGGAVGAPQPEGSLGGLMTDLLECSVCLEPLDTSHRVLPCQHTFCIECLEDLASKQKKKGVAEEQNGSRPPLFLCPECRAEIHTPISSLPTNVILNRILSGLNQPKIQSPNVTPTAKKTSTTATPLAPAPPPLAIGDHRKLPLPSPTTFRWDNNNIPGNWKTNPFLSPSSPPQSPLPVLPPKLAPVAAPPPIPARPPAASPAPHQLYRALYDYKPIKSDELALKKDELYFVIEKCQDGWYKGSSLTSLKTGVFPGNYVQHVQEDSIQKSGKLKTSSKSSSKQERTSGPDLIDFSSDIMDVFAASTTTSTSSSNSLAAQVKSKKLVKQKEADEAKSNQQQRERVKESLILYRATIPFPASSQYELELKMGDVIIMNKIREDGWCKGTLQRSGQTGLFPLSFVEKIS